MKTEEQLTHTRLSTNWYLIFLASSTYALVRMLPMKCMPVLFKEISVDLGLNMVQIGFVWGMIPLGAAIILPICGMICDRFGVRRTLTVTCILTGLTGSMRGFAGDFATLIATTFLFGVINSVIVPGTAMAASSAFPKQRQGLAQGVLMASSAIGGIVAAMISATILSPLLNGWRNVLFLYGGISIVVGLLWFFTLQESEKASSVRSQNQFPFAQTLSRLLRIKALWFLGLVGFAYVGSEQAMCGFLPLYLREKGWSATTADGVLATFNAVSALGTIPLALLSDKIGSRKTVMTMACVAAIIGIGLLSVVHNEVVWILIILSGFFFNAVPAMLSTMCIEMEAIGPAYIGTALALNQAISMIGSFALPPLGNSLAYYNLGLPFVFWALIAGVGLVMLGFVRETGLRAKKLSN